MSLRSANQVRELVFVVICCLICGNWEIPGRSSLSGFLHGVWYLPLILLTSFYLAEGNPLLTIPLRA